MRQTTLQIKLISLVVTDQYFHCTIARPSLQTHVGYHTVRILSDLTFGYSMQQTIHENLMLRPASTYILLQCAHMLLNHVTRNSPLLSLQCWPHSTV